MLMNTREAADAIGVSVPTIHRMVERGELVAAAKAPGARGAFLFDREEVERVAASRRAAE